MPLFGSSSLGKSRLLKASPSNKPDNKIRESERYSD